MMAAINLTKGQRIDLTKTHPGLTKAIIGLGWNTPETYHGHDYDLDASAFLLGANGKCRRDSDFIFYNNLTGPGIEHTGDNRTGEGDGDDEQLIINFSEIPADVDRIAFTVTIHDAHARGQNFGQVEDAFIRLVDAETNEEILRYDLGEDFSIETSVVFCDIYRHDGEWKFNAIGAGFQNGLAALVRSYGLDA